jgi:hypothetical protein
MRIVLCEALLAVAMLGCGGGSPVGDQSESLDKEAFFPSCSQKLLDVSDGEMLVAPVRYPPPGTTLCASNHDEFVCDRIGNWQLVPSGCGAQCGITVQNACGLSIVCPDCPQCPCGGDFPHCADCCPEPPGCSPDWGG